MTGALDHPRATSEKPLTGKAGPMVKGTGLTEPKLTARQADLLDRIVCADAYPDDDCFSDLRTVNALIRRGLIETRPFPRDCPENILMAAMGAEELVATPAGRAAIARAEAASRPSPTSPGAQEDRSDGKS